MAKGRHRGRQPRARALCRHFTHPDFVGCAVGGLTALETAHKPVVTSAGLVGCGVALDRCRQQSEPEAPRWDYVFTHRSENIGYAVEVHHADANEATRIIAKKAWASSLLGTRCAALEITDWIWIASPPDGAILFPRQHPVARQLAEAGIHFPVKSIELP